MSDKTTINVHLHMPVDNVSQMLAALLILEKREVLAGFPADINEERQTEDGTSSPINNATLGYLQNFGSPAQGIPAREFMESGLLSKQDAIVAKLAQTGGKALDGDLAAVDRGLIAVGLLAESGIKNKIRTGPFIPLAKSTLAARRRRGRTGIKPLQDTGQLRNAVTSVVADRKL